MPHKVQDKNSLDLLYKTIARLKTPEEVAALLEDLCTPKEVQDMAQRITMAFMLADGESYVAIQEATGGSATTVARVSRALNQGANGYVQAIKLYKEEEQND